MRRETPMAGKLAVVLALLLATAVAAPALAVDVYLNGNKITGYQDVDFGKVKVKLDQSGNVRIDAPDFKVQEVGGSGPTAAPSQPAPPQPTPPPNPAGLQKQYFIVTEGSQPGGTGYDVKLIINNQYIKTLPDTIPQHVVELNQYLKAGANSISFFAKRQDRAAKSPTDTFDLMIGAGDARGGQLNIEQVLYEFKLTGADPVEKAKTFQIVAK